MLIEFNVTNFKSIKETQTLKITAVRSNDELTDNIFTSSTHGIRPLLKSTVIYGPNAAGKSNIIQAVAFMKYFVISSSKERQEGDTIKVVPFLFDKASKLKETDFEVVFIENKIRYQYGFSVNNKIVTQEWLLAFPEGRAQRWFERQFDCESQSYKWYFGPKFTGNRKVWKDATRSNALFLSTAIQLNNEQLKPVFKWFQKIFILTQGSHLIERFSITKCKDELYKNKILDFMNAADLSISDITVEEKELSPESLSDDIPKRLKDQIIKDAAEKIGTVLVHVKFLHQVSDKKEIAALDLRDESAGTQKLFAYAGPWIDILEKGSIMFIDELDTSFHPLIVRFLIRLINNPSTNSKNAQLIFTTHNTSLLDKEIFRRDQVWFVEKDSENSTQLYPLTDFSPRKGEALEKGYLHGRYGALPFTGDLNL